MKRTVIAKECSVCGARADVHVHSIPYCVACWEDHERSKVAQEATRDPGSDPQPGDILRGDGKIRRVIKRDGEILICETGGKRYRMRVGSWRAWCEKSGATVSW